MRRTILAATLLLSLAACSEVAPPPPPEVSQPGDPVLYRVQPCGISPLGYPCVDSKRRVWRNTKGHFTPVTCGAEDGGPVLPCLGRDTDRDGNYLLFLAPNSPNPWI